jgi:hypothetical protein
MKLPTGVEREINRLQAGQRLEMAKQKLERMSKLLGSILQIDIINDDLCYSDTLSKQIPVSRAAHTFNAIRHSMFAFSIVRVCSIWEKPDLSACNFPTIHRLLDDDLVFDLIEAEVRENHRIQNQGFYAETNFPEPVLAQWRSSDEARLQTDIGDMRRNLRRCLRYIAALESREKLTSLRNERHKNIAHNLDQTREEAKAKIEKMRYGDEKYFLRKALFLFEWLYLYVNHTSFSLQRDSREILTTQSQEFFEAISFDFTEPREGA